MLLTITCEGQHTQDLGYLLHKNPNRPQVFELSFGKAYVFYPEVSDTRTTAALLLDIDPLDLAKGKPGSRGGGLFDYVNDRPYASTSFMSTAIARIFNTAMGGRCPKRPELPERPLQLEARLYALKDNGNEELASRLFKPLGYEVTTSRTLLDEQFPEWGLSPYIDLRLRGTVRLCDLLNHLYVLIPVFDTQKHYYCSKDEIQKLLDHGAGWLASHPCREIITHRYLRQQFSYVSQALMQLRAEDEAEETESETAETVGSETSAEAAAQDSAKSSVSLNTLRLQAVRQVVLDSGAGSVIDMGCGEGNLTQLLLKEPQIRKLAACDVSPHVLETLARRLHTDRLPQPLRDKLELFQASLVYRDKRFTGYDCACIVEVIEHIDPGRLQVFERVVFACAAPKTVILTTPNREYNIRYTGLREGALRHRDHRFEWSRAEFKAWTERICSTYGYACEIRGIGEDSDVGTSTQMGVFVKHGD